MLGLLVFISTLGVLIVVHEFGHFILAKAVKVRVEKFSLGLGPQFFKRKKGDTDYCLSVFPVGGFVKLAGDNLEEFKGGPDEYFSKPPGKRFWIIFAGPFLNYLLGIIILWLIFFAGYPTLTTKVGGLLKDFGAEKAGLLAGDTVIAIDGKKVKYWEELQKTVQSKQGVDKVTLTILRDKQESSLVVSIREKQLEDGMGGKRKAGILGITPDYDSILKVRYGLGESFLLSVTKAWDLTQATYQGLWRMICGRVSIRDSVTGPLGIFYITSKTASLGITALLHLIAVLSISLGIFNLLPLPVLDGGHIFLLMVEKIRGKALGLKADQFINQAGVTLIISLAIFVTYNDIVRLFGDKISKLFR
ncbi:MAG TPA: RIP metalloprotease RseP [Candidatus Margulisiibacteriota bacterium]|nr:RIP metalloprotease RseP [Candidatus Margulisiibacteriota bacterium]